MSTHYLSLFIIIFLLLSKVTICNISLRIDLKRSAMIETLLTMKELSELLKVDRMTITRWVRVKPDFPKPIKIERKNLWKRSEIEAYIESQKCKK